MGPGRYTNWPAPSPSTQESESPSPPSPAARVSWLGLPRLSWSLTLLGLCVFTFAIVSYYFDIATVGIAIAAAGLLLQRGGIILPLPSWLFGTYVLWALVSAIVSPSQDIALNQVVGHLKLLIIFVVAINALRTEGQLRFYLLFFLGAFILFPIRGTLVGGDTYPGYPQGRVVWNYIYSSPNELGMRSLIALGIALGFVFSTQCRKLVRLGAGLSAVLLMVVLLLTQSRGAFIGLVAGFGPTLIWLGLKRPVRLLFYGGILALVIAITIPPGVLERLSGIAKLTSVETIAEADVEGSAAERFEIQKVGWQIFLDHPFFGVGPGVYQIENARYAPELGERDTHNTYLNLAAEVGLPGLALWCATVLSVLLFAYRRRRQAAPRDLAIQQAWVERGLWGYLAGSIFMTNANITFLFLMCAVVWCSATLLAPPSPHDQGAARATKA